MQRILPILSIILFVLFFTGCTEQIEQVSEKASNESNDLITPTSENAAITLHVQFPPKDEISNKPKTLLPAPQTLLAAIRDVSELRSPAFSPNGEWVIQDISRSDGLYSVSSTISSDILFVEQASLEYYTLGWRLRNPWSPNSDAFYVAATDQPAAGCPYTSIVIHNIEQGGIHSATFNGDELGYCIVASWSPDGESLAITANNAGVIYIVDKNAEVKQIIDLDLANHDHAIDDIFWLNGGIILNTHYNLGKNVSPQTRGTHDELILVKIDGRESQPIFSSDTDSFRLITADPNSPRILVKQLNDTDIEEQLVVYNLETNKVEAIWSINGNINGNFQGITMQIELSIQDKDSKEWFCCWSFDWETFQIEYLGERALNYAYRLGWYAPQNGYIVVMDEQDPKNSIAIVQP